MRIFRIILCGALVCLYAPGAKTQELAGADLAEFCAAPEESHGMEICRLYTQWVLSGVAIGAMLSKKDTLCLPQGVSWQQLAAEWTKYLGSHPEEWEQNGMILVSRAMADAFPCSKQKTSN